MLRVAVLVSGGGTNLQAIIDAVQNGTITNTEIVGVISNNKSAYALERAKNHDIPAICVSPKEYENREKFNEALLNAVDELKPDLVVLAGCLVIIPEKMIDAYLNYAKGMPEEISENINVTKTVQNLIRKLNKGNFDINFSAKKDYFAVVKPVAFERAISNIITNAIIIVFFIIFFLLSLLIFFLFSLLIFLT